jgi:phosphate transport system permease protein
MSTQMPSTPNVTPAVNSEDSVYSASVRRRQTTARIGQFALLASLIFALIVLIVLIVDVADQTGGVVVYKFKTDPASVVPSIPLEELDKPTLLELVQDNVPAERLQQLPDELGTPIDQLDQQGLIDVLYAEVDNPDTLTGRPLETLSNDELVTILDNNITDARFEQLNAEKAFTTRSREELLELVEVEVLELQVAKSWRLFESLTNRAAINAEIDRDFRGQPSEFKTWLTPEFITGELTTRAETTGIRTALLGSLMMVALTILIAVPIGIGAGIYLEEFADKKSRIAQIIQTNIYNLSGVPSIIYGMLGLAIFVRALGSITNGSLFGIPDAPPNGRTIISAAMTMALLVLPLVIINTQEAIRAVPQSLRDGSLALGATKWQTVWNHVLPVAAPGILTGMILATARSVGETAPLIVVGAAAYLSTDPSGPFSSFTVLPIQIYNWTSLPDQTFKNIAAAAIILLLFVVILFNLTAIILRNRLRKTI